MASLVLSRVRCRAVFSAIFVALVFTPRSPGPGVSIAPFHLAGADASLSALVRKAKDLVGQQWRSGSRDIAPYFGVTHGYIKLLLGSDPVSYEKYKSLAEHYASITEETRAAVGSPNFDMINRRNGPRLAAIRHEVKLLLERVLGKELVTQQSLASDSSRGGADNGGPPSQVRMRLYGGPLGTGFTDINVTNLLSALTATDESVLFDFQPSLQLQPGYESQAQQRPLAAQQGVALSDPLLRPGAGETNSRLEQTGFQQAPSQTAHHQVQTPYQEVPQRVRDPHQTAPPEIPVPNEAMHQKTRVPHEMIHHKVPTQEMLPGEMTRQQMGMPHQLVWGQPHTAQSVEPSALAPFVRPAPPHVHTPVQPIPQHLRMPLHPAPQQMRPQHGAVVGSQQHAILDGRKQVAEREMEEAYRRNQQMTAQLQRLEGLVSESRQVLGALQNSIGEIRTFNDSSALERDRFLQVKEGIERTLQDASEKCVISPQVLTGAQQEELQKAFIRERTEIVALLQTFRSQYATFQELTQEADRVAQEAGVPQNPSPFGGLTAMTQILEAMKQEAETLRAEAARVVKLIEGQHLQLQGDVSKFARLLADAVKTCVTAVESEENRLTGASKIVRDQAAALLGKLGSVAERASRLRHRQDMLGLERLRTEKAGWPTDDEPQETEAIAEEVAMLQASMRSLTVEVDSTIGTALGLGREVEALRNGKASFPAPVGSQELRQRLEELGRMLVELQQALATSSSNALSQTTMAASKLQHARAADEARAAMRKKLQPVVEPARTTQAQTEVATSAPGTGAMNGSDVQSGEYDLTQDSNPDPN
ncbi:hypothetical protein CSUI_007093 [Cystoisospora suis]|uniref:Transmembrane protein n=1 Tax=Cystoisospora suis TaxID=483139 RepID=A0A2C6KRR5_9APIC|nr:hypothetical protein CSUI_007093 [Cystoisospora suis]